MSATPAGVALLRDCATQTIVAWLDFLIKINYTQNQISNPKKMAFNTKSKYFTYILALLFLFSIAFPMIAIAADAAGCTSLVCCGNAGTDPCTLNDAFALVNRVVKFILFTLAPALAVIWFSFAGFTYLTSAGDPSKVQRAKNMIIYVVVGLLIAYTAWGLIYWFIGSIGGNSDLLLHFFDNPTP
jgi:hypothetical protein